MNRSVCLVLRRVREKLRVLSMTKAEHEAYNRHLENIMVQNGVLDTARTEGRDEGIEIGIGIGIEKGIEKANIENARKMMALNVPIEVITQVTGLSSEQLMSLKT